MLQFYHCIIDYYSRIGPSEHTCLHVVLPHFFWLKSDHKWGTETLKVKNPHKIKHARQFITSLYKFQKFNPITGHKKLKSILHVKVQPKPCITINVIQASSSCSSYSREIWFIPEVHEGIDKDQFNKLSRQEKCNQNLRVSWTMWGFGDKMWLMNRYHSDLQ